MNKEIKRVLALVLAVLVGLSLTACGPQAGGDTTSTTTATAAGEDTVTTTVAVDGETTTVADGQSTTTVGGADNTTKATTTTTKVQSTGGELSWAQVKAKMPAKLKNTTLTLFNWNAINYTYGAVNAIGKFEKETGIKVKWEVGAYDEYIPKIIARVATETAPDIVRLNDTDISLIKVLQPISNLNYDFSDAAWNEKLMSEYNVNGKVYGMILDKTPYYQPLMTFYNRNLISRYKLDDPYDLWKEGKWTWSAAFELCEEYVEAAGGNASGFSLIDGCEISHQMGYPLLVYDKENSQYRSNASEPTYIKAWQFVSNNIKKGYFDKVFANRDGFNAGEVLFINDSAIAARSTHFYFQELIKKGEIGLVPLPAVNGQKTYITTLSENEAYAVPQGASNPEAVPYFLRYFLDEAHYDMSKFYFDEQAREVVDWNKNQDYVKTMERIIYQDQYGTNIYSISYGLRQTDSAQMKTQLDKVVPVLNQIVKDGNAAIKALK